jgi:hypothetical protein
MAHLDAGASPVERTLRRKTSALRPAAGHGLGLGSGSGAGLWLNGSAEATDDEHMVDQQLGLQEHTYHIPAELAGRGGKGMPTGLGLSLDGEAIASEMRAAVSSDEVDLDLSFDFVSSLEGHRRYVSHDGEAPRAVSAASSLAPTPQRPSNPTPSRAGAPTSSLAGTPTHMPGSGMHELGVPNVPSLVATSASPSLSPASPRGMATAASWTTRQRKRPPAPLNFLRPGAVPDAKKKQRAQLDELNTRSYFSPVTPQHGGNMTDDGDIDSDDSPLPRTPLSATRRGVDAGLSRPPLVRASSSKSSLSLASGPSPHLPPTEPLPALPSNADVAQLVRQQRMKAQAKQLRGEGSSAHSHSTSASSGSHYALGVEVLDAPGPSQSRASSFDAARSSSEAMEEVAADEDDEYDYRRHLRHQPHPRSAPLRPPTASSAGAASFATAQAPARAAKREGDRDSSGSMESFMTAITAATGEAHDSALAEVPPPLPSSNALGLSLGASDRSLPQPQPHRREDLRASRASSGILLADDFAAYAALQRTERAKSASASPLLSDSGDTSATPSTLFSPLFSEPGTARTGAAGSEYTHTTASSVGSPVGNFSKLFSVATKGRRASAADALLAAPNSASMGRLMSAPGEGQAGVSQQTIREEATGSPSEEGVHERRRERTVSGMPRSETAQWIRSQGGVAADDADSDEPVHEPMVISSDSTDAADELFRPRTSFAASEGAGSMLHYNGARRMSDVKGPWPQSPLLLDVAKASSSPAAPISAADAYARAIEGGMHAQASGLNLHEALVDPIVRESEPSFASNLGIGLGLDLGAPAVVEKEDSSLPTMGLNARHETDVTVARVHLTDARQALADTAAGMSKPLASAAVSDRLPLKPSASFSSSIEGFACNVTPPIASMPLPGMVEDVSIELQAPVRAKVAIAAGETQRNSTLSVLDPAATSDLSRPSSKAHNSTTTGWGALSNLRWGNRFFSVASSSAVSGSDALADSRPTPMRSLTLVDKRDVQSRRAAAIAERRTSQGHRRSRSREDLASIVQQLKKSDRGVASAPASAVLPDAATFQAADEPTTTMPEAAHTEGRSSKRVKRRSRIRYLSNGNEIHLNIGEDAEPNAQPAPLDELKSPRVAASPTGWTPRLHFGPFWAAGGSQQTTEGEMPAQDQGMQQAGSPATPGSPWLDFEDGDGGMQASRDRLRLLASQAMPGATLPHQYLTGEAEGLRHRSILSRPAHRPCASVPPTATIVPYGWASGANKRASGSARVLLHDAETWEEGVIDVEERRARGVAQEQAQGRPMSIFVPTSAIEAHLLRAAGVSTNLDARREQRRSRMLAPLRHPAAVFGETLPSRSLFFAGFLGMPWLWLIGGWYVGSDGLLITPSEGKVAFWQHEDSMREAADRDAAESMPQPQHSPQWSESNRQDSTAFESAHDVSLGNGSRGLRREQSSSSMYADAAFNAVRSSHLRSQPSRDAITAERVPTSRSRSISGMLSSAPEVALFRSPVRHIDESPDPGAEFNSPRLGNGHHGSASALRAVLEEATAPRPASYSPQMDVHDEKHAQQYEGTHQQATLADDSWAIPFAHQRMATATRTEFGLRAMLRRWRQLEPFVLYNRIAAILASILVLWGMGAALAVVGSSF